MKKVCVISTSLAKGGAERSSAILSQMLFKLGYKVHLLITKNDIDYEFSGILFNLEQKYGSNLTDFKKIKVLRKYFKSHNFDIIIDNRTRPSFLKEYVLYHYVFLARKKISVVRSFYLKRYFPNSKFFTRLLYKKKTTLVAVSKEIKNAIVKNYGLNNIWQIYNPIEIDSINIKANENISVGGEFILWYGRIENSVKNFDLLLKAYKKSTLPKKNIKLCIIGQGNDVGLLGEKINDLQLEDKVYYLPFLKNPFPYVKKALFTVLTSYYEGFPRVLIESLSCGTPVVSVDCKSGPNEIIKHNHNGLLVENHNEMALAKAFNSFIEDKILYKTCKNNARKSVERFSIENTAKEWKELLK